MDIDLKGESGLDCAKTMTELDPKVKIIFATAHSEYMANAFEIYAFDYLVKPFNLERMEKTLSRIRAMQLERGQKQENETVSAAVAEDIREKVHRAALEMPLQEEQETEAKDKVMKLSEQHKEKLMIKGKEQMTFLDKKDIIMVERLDGMTIITTTEGIFQTSASLGSIEEKLDPEVFMRCHKSYLINLSKISQIEVYGRWTYTVKLKQTGNTALMTAQKYEEVKKMFE